MTKLTGYLEKKVRKTIRQYKLFDQKSRVLVAVSGGKDSTVCVYLLKKLGYDVEAITIDASIGNYTEVNLKNIKKVCKKYDIKLHVVSFRKEFGKSLCYMRDVLRSKGHKYSSCMLCGILKRYLLNKYARMLKADVLATGHNLDDEAQAFLMNVFKNDFFLAKKQGPKSAQVSKKFIPRVKPLYLITEEEALKFSKLMKFPVKCGICPCSVGAHRRKHKNILDELEKKNPGVKYSVIRFQEEMKAGLKKTKKAKVNLCECGEPTKGEICRVCQIFKELKV